MRPLEALKHNQFWQAKINELHDMSFWARLFGGLKQKLACESPMVFPQIARNICLMEQVPIKFDGTHFQNCWWT